jgi:hypothetical protein
LEATKKRTLLVKDVNEEDTSPTLRSIYVNDNEMDVLPKLLPANLNDKNVLTSMLCPVHYNICGSAKKITDVVVVAPPNTITLMIM